MRTLLSWSTGKDSAWALHVLRQRADVDVVGLVTTINAAFDRVAMHGVRRALVEAQAEAAGLPLHVLEIPHPCPNAEYERVMGAFVAAQAAAGVEAMAFGDLFLEDIRRYREAQARRHRHHAAVPAVGHRHRGAGARDDRRRARGPRRLPRSAQAAGGLRRPALRSRLLAELPAGIDPCAENGEFHTFASAGPMFRSPIAVEAGEVVTRDGFVFCDLVPYPRAPHAFMGRGLG